MTLRARRWWLGGMLVTGLVPAVTCDRVPTAPQPGTFRAVLEGARVDDRAVLLSIGGEVVDVRGGSAAVVVHAGWGDTIATVAAFGPLTGTPLLEVTVRDVRRPLRSSVLEVADIEGNLRQDLGGYLLWLAR